MTETNLITKLKAHLVEAGFVESISLINSICQIPPRTFVMHNCYALVAIYKASPEESGTSSLLIKVKEDMHIFIRKVLSFLENKKGLIVDGYLVIELNHEPDDTTKEILQEIESDTKVCRKYIVWPAEDESSLDRLKFITILSLPDPLQSNNNTSDL